MSAATGAGGAPGSASAGHSAGAAGAQGNPAARYSAAGAGGSPGNSPTAADICAEPGCGGKISDGYCEVCGTAPGPVGTAAFAPSATTQTGGSSASTGSRSGRASGRSVRTGRGSSGATRGRLGAGMVNVPRVPRIQPVSAVLENAQVPEHQRYCGKCDRPVGRGREGQPGRAEGFCGHCGTRFSFTPKLSRGQAVGQYEVLGPLAHGGLGWIYLAVDHKVNDRPVVLKGLLNTGDADAMRAAVAERRFLAQVDHPNIVRIYNFAEETGPDGEPVGYIVMEYVGGTSLKQLLRRHRETEGTHLPPARAIAYVLEMLPALGYLHSYGWAYCDFKPDNVMQTEEQLKLIDLGAVIAMNDEHSAIYGTAGYQAPEIAETGPTIATEVYTVGRTLAVLLMSLPTENGRLGPLPTPDTEPVLARHESLYRFLLRATDPDPEARFSSMEEMADQLTGVLREVLATDDGLPRPGLSARFGPSRGVFGVGDELPDDPAKLVAALPVPLVDPNDTGAALLASTSAVEPEILERELAAGLRSVVTGQAESVEIPLRLVRAALEFGAVDDALRRLDELEDPLTGDWRLTWYRGLARLLQRDWTSAAAEFDALYTALPGEAAPKLALAVTAENLGNHGNGTDPEPARRRAITYYEAVWRTDRGYTSAAFGLARLRRLAQDRTGAITVLDQVDRASAVHTEAGIAAVDILLDVDRDGQLTETLLRDAGGRVEGLRLDSKRVAAQARLRVLDAALHWLTLGRVPTGQAPLLGSPLDQPGVRTGLERCYRDLAREADDMWERIALVEQANSVRPRTTL
ncbi:serine/threonine-protein kinase PknG [Nocardia yamanashiensis]|uniref:serine/threonine-protein kinase n=1 Tax=Nocardia yamanashiensis TaxID=209247 RepID=UPI001E44D5FF|nr:serine/threonine-protein kinase [Nocardia yamanashiensis]UGT45699.1 serine/threonine-protein kinase PknG [Nocardia yamanashiensis]